jgi:hypothetical protein
MSVSTYKACRRWWEARGYIAIARNPSSRRGRRAGLSSVTPVYECRWDCKTHQTRRDAARAPGHDHGAAVGVDDGSAPAGPNGSVWTPDLRAALEGLMR